tara:strand:- start:829 stop:1752 length:924 start_codon:yes stop_codon:yes gene_type:complete
MSGIIAGAAILGGVAAYGIHSGNKKAKAAQDAANANNTLTAQIAADNLAFQKEQQKKLDAQKDIYRAMEFKNPYENMENAYEDLTVNQLQAQFQVQQGAQQRANIMDNLRGAAGGSGIAALAQTMANQGQLQNQQIAAQLGQQEMAIARAKASAAESIDLKQRGGEAMVQDMERSRQSTLLGISMGESAGANAAAMQAQSNQVAAGAAEASMLGQQSAAMYGMAGQAIGGLTQMATASDRKLKKNINKIGESPSGLNIYSFEYKNPIYGQGKFQGVMSDEISREVIQIINGYDAVDYSMIDVEFKQI